MAGKPAVEQRGERLCACEAIAHSAATLVTVATPAAVFSWCLSRAVWAAVPVISPAAPATVAAMRLARMENPIVNTTTDTPRKSSAIAACWTLSACHYLWPGRAARIRAGTPAQRGNEVGGPRGGDV